MKTQPEASHTLPENQPYSDYDAIYDEYDRETARLRERLLGANRPIHDVLVENFRGSFKLSNGSAILQFLLYVQITDLLNIRHETDSIKETTYALESYPDTIKLPRRHRRPKIPPYTKFEDRTDSIWQTCMAVVRNRQTLDNLEQTQELSGDYLDKFKLSADPEGIHLAIPLYMIQNDLIYLEHGRPGRTDEKAKYRSHVRDYCLLDKPIGSPELDYTAQEAGVLIKAVANPDRIVHEDDEDLFLLSESVMELADKWEERHGEQFFPAGIFDR